MIFRQSLHPPPGKVGASGGAKKRQAVIEMLNTQMIFESQKEKRKKWNLTVLHPKQVYSPVFFYFCPDSCVVCSFLSPPPLCLSRYI